MRYFVDKLPNDCRDCDCCHTRDYDWKKQYDGDKFCGIEDLDVTDRYAGFEYPTRPDWCPLEVLPEKVPKLKSECDYDWGYRRGWNDCIEEIVGE